MARNILDSKPNYCKEKTQLVPLHKACWYDSYNMLCYQKYAKLAAGHSQKRWAKLILVPAKNSFVICKVDGRRKLNCQVNVPIKEFARKSWGSYVAPPVNNLEGIMQRHTS